MNLCQLNTFFLSFWPICCNEKSVQLAEVHLYRIYFLQNPYFKEVPSFKESFSRNVSKQKSIQIWMSTNKKAVFSILDIIL